MAMLALLGPQRLKPTVHTVADHLGVKGPIATITAGWEERETEDDELAGHLARPTVNLQLYHRAEALYLGDPELREAFVGYLASLRERQALYRLRLEHALDAARELLRRPGRSSLLDEEREAAIAAVHRLDDHHLESVRRMRDAYEERIGLATREAVRREREQVRAEIDECDAVAIAGGHVGVLLHVARLFDLRTSLDERVILAWSAGAMMLADRIVLFHDSPPQGAGNAEIFAPGLALFNGILPLPHARRRLQLEDPLRVGLLSRRFGTHACIAMDEGDHFVLDGRAVPISKSVRRLMPDGSVIETTVAAGEAG